MAKTRLKSKGRRDGGSFVALPHALLKCDDFLGLSGAALKVLLHIAGQYNGKNNGDLSATRSGVEVSGVRSSSTLAKAIADLQERRLIVCTRKGRFMKPGGRCALYALTWQAVDECQGKDLEHPPTATPLRSLSLERNKKPASKIEATQFENRTQ